MTTTQTTTRTPAQRAAACSHPEHADKFRFGVECPGCLCQTVFGEVFATTPREYSRGQRLQDHR